MLEVKPAPVYKKVIFPAKALKKEAIKNEPKYENKIFLTRSSPSKDSKRSPSPPRHDLKMIIAKKPSPSYTIEDKTKLNKPSTSVKDFKRLRSNEIKCSEYSSTTSFLPKTIESSSARKNVTGTVPLDDSKHFKSYDYGRSKKLDKDDETLLNRHKEEKNTIRLMRQRRFSTGERYTKPKKVPEYDVPKLKIELPSLKTKITVPKQPNENYAISPASASLKSPTCTKKVRFMFPIENLKLKFDRKDPKESEKEGEGNSQVEYAKKIGLKPVERAAENIVHKKRKKSKHSKEEPSFKKRKLQAEFSSSLDESLKLKVKFTGVKPEKHERKSNHISEERSVKVEEKEKKKIVNENKKNLVSDEIRVQNHINPFTNLQPMVCIPNLNLKEMDTAKTSEAPTITLVVPLFASNPITSFTSTTVTPVSNSINDSIQKKVEKCVASQGCQTKSPSFTARSLTAKMGSPSGSPKLPIPQRTYMSSTAQSPNVRPQSMPLSLGLSPISSLQSEQNLKRSLSADYTTVVTKQPRSDYADVFERFNNKTHFPQTILRQYSNPHQMKMPMLVSTSNGKPVDKVMPNASAVSSFSNIAKANEYYKKYPDIQKRPLPMLIAPSSVSVTKTSEISVPSPSMDDRPSVEILRISPNVVLHDKQMFGPPQEQKRQEIKPKPAAIPLAKIKKSGINMQNYMNSNQLIFGTGIVQKTPNDLPKLVSYQLPKCQKPEFKRPQQGMTFGFATNLYPPSMSPKSNNATKPNESPEQFTHNQDLVNLNQQLSIDIAKLSQSLNQDVTATSSVEKISSYANILTGIATSYTENMRLRMSQMHPPNNPVSNPSNNVSRQQNMSVRNVPNPSALMFRQQPQKTVNSPISSPTSSIFANAKMLPNDKKTTFNDIEDFLSKTTIGTTNPVTTISTTPQIKDKQLQTVKKNLHLEKLAANLLAAAENKTSSEHLVGQERASDNKVTITIGKLPEKNNNDDSNNNNTNGDIKASDKISTKETTDEGKAGAKIHANSSQTERNDA